MYQISYVSSSTSLKEHLSQDLKDILTEARHFNFCHDLTGALYFVDGTFFQCLEGPQLPLQHLVAKLQQDKRHAAIKFFEMKALPTRIFTDWSMKYVTKNSAIQNFLRENHCSNFDPDHFNQQQLHGLLQMIALAEQARF